MTLPMVLPLVSEAPISGTALLERSLELAEALDIARPNLDRQFTLSLIIHVPVLPLGDVTALAWHLLLDAASALPVFPQLLGLMDATRAALDAVPAQHTVMA